MTVFIIVVITTMLIEIIGLLFVLRYMNRKIIDIEDQLSTFNRNASAFIVDTEKYLSQYESERIMEDFYKEREMTAENILDIIEIWKKSFN